MHHRPEVCEEALEELLEARRIDLYIGEHTVETHLARAYAQLGVHTRLELARAIDALDAR